ncbi:restriction endonuclease subunit S [Accumulibacter sp.]|jgi:type I restriction enzyme S subunit|uniref:Restriction modification system DNA specificity domain protein n=1 Tax=Accumulibacter regalis TaxID=522306 RepID=C7RKB3_ACCRE|nr:restriction endonuclease subunit S [Accumulibacter sp.]MBN8499512.1 restriction endonuclease subunit S [Accumulibacter sp.]MBO3713720.1 restriction endonuclease subunit S [Accumulibacter sp.]
MLATLFSSRRLKYAATINDETLSESTDADFELAYIDIGNVDSQGRFHDIVNHRFDDAPSRARRIVRDGDVIVSTVRTYLQAIASVENPPDNLIVSTGFAVVRPSNELDHRFCKYALRASSFLWGVESRSTGVSYPAINASDLGDINVSLPELGAQRLIASYLDRETARIDGLIAEKERMLALLEEKRAALISRVVTRGLDPNSPLKPSGQEWLGEIPAHWPTTKFSWDVFISEGQVDPEDDRFLEMILVAPNHIESRTGEVTHTETSADQGAMSGKYFCKQGDVLYSKIRPALRKVVLAEDDCLCSADMYALRPSKRLMPEYLQYFLLSEDFSVWAELESARVAMPKINRETFSAIRIPVPPLEEQERIVLEIRDGAKRIDLQRKAVRGSVELLKERRAALITAAVSGQIPLEEMTG